MRQFALALVAFAACSDNNSTMPARDLSASADAASRFDASDASEATAAALPTRCNGSVMTAIATAGPAPTAVAALTVPAGFMLERIASVGNARELVALPNGDLLVGSSGPYVYLVPNAEGAAGTPSYFVKMNDSPAQGIAYAPATCTIYVATQSGVYSMPYTDGALTGTATKIASVRTGAVAPNSDGDVHTTSSVAVAGGMLYVGVGSSCNACTETDPTRATIQQFALDGTAQTTRATRIRNAIALAENPATHTLWAGGAGQDGLPLGHPYEYFDAVTLHPGVADYGWPGCEENHVAYVTGANCTGTVAPLAEFPPYSTLIGATFYANTSGAHAFPANYRGGAFVAMHGSWHTQSDGTFYSPPRVAYLPITGDAPNTAVNWSNPAAQWTDFVTGFQAANNLSRNAKATGVAVGAQGSLFIADDQNSGIYRVRPTATH